MWLLIEDGFHLIKKTWSVTGSIAFQVTKKLMSSRNFLIKWDKETHDKLQVKINQLQNKLD